MRILGEGIDGLVIVEAKAGFSRSCLRNRNSGIEDVLDAMSPSSGRIFLRLAASAKSDIHQGDPRILNCTLPKMSWHLSRPVKETDCTHRSGSFH